MRSICSLLTAFLILGWLLAGCAEESWEPALGEYVYETSEEGLKPSVTLKEGLEFRFIDSPLSSYLIEGTYEIENDRVICTTDDKNRTYVFERSGDDLAFRGEDSTELPAFARIPDRAVFKLSDPV